MGYSDGQKRMKKMMSKKGMEPKKGKMMKEGKMNYKGSDAPKIMHSGTKPAPAKLMATSKDMSSYNMSHINTGGQDMSKFRDMFNEMPVMDGGMMKGMTTYNFG